MNRYVASLLQGTNTEVNLQESQIFKGIQIITVSVHTAR